MEKHRGNKVTKEKDCTICRNPNHQRYILLKPTEIENCVKCFKLKEPRYGFLCAPCHLRLHRWVQNCTKYPEKSWKHVVDSHLHNKDSDDGIKGEARSDSEGLPLEETRGRRKHRSRRRTRARVNAETEVKRSQVKRSRATTSRVDWNSKKDETEVPTIPLENWKIYNRCCGQILVGPNNQVLIDPRLVNLECSICYPFKLCPSGPSAIRECVEETDEEFQTKKEEEEEGCDRNHESPKNSEYASTTETSSKNSNIPEVFADVVNGKLVEREVTETPSDRSDNNVLTPTSNSMVSTQRVTNSGMNENDEGSPSFTPCGSSLICKETISSP